MVYVQPLVIWLLCCCLNCRTFVAVIIIQIKIEAITAIETVVTVRVIARIKEDTKSAHVLQCVQFAHL